MYRKDKKNEFFTIKARKEGYPARSVYKFAEINRKFGILKPNDIVLDLGCVPGSWLLYCAESIGENGKIVGVDINSCNISLPKNAIFLQADILKLKTTQLTKYFREYDAVISDMAPSTSGVEFVDAGRSLELSKRAFEISTEVLKRGGNFVCKIFESYEANQLIKEVEKYFVFIKHFRPKAVIKNSKEFYIVAKGLKL
jgi:23S rRNA (uridine2552-2'-O)-methyltransferase